MSNKIIVWHKRHKRAFQMKCNTNVFPLQYQMVHITNDYINKQKENNNSNKLMASTCLKPTGSTT